MTRTHYRLLATIGCAIAALALGLVAPAPLKLDGPLLDGLIWGRAVVGVPRTSEPNSVAVVALDERSLESAELAQYPRALYGPVWAKLIDALVESGARAVGFDLLLTYTANRLVPDFDRPFLATLAAHRERVVLARSSRSLPAPPFLAALDPDEHSLGVAEIPIEPDGVYRHVPRAYRTDAPEELPSFSAAVLGRAGRPSMPQTLLLVPREHPEATPTYAIADVLRCAATSPRTLAEAFAGRIVLVGSTLPDEDRKLSSARFLRPSPPGPRLGPCGLHHLGASSATTRMVPGVHLHAIAIDAVARGHVTRTMPSFFIAILAGLVAGSSAVIALTRAPWQTIVSVVVGAALLLVAATMSLRHDLWIPVALPLAVIVSAPAVAYVVRYLVEERTRRRIQLAFGRYLSPYIVDQLAGSSAHLRLGGERREITVMFADLSGFTALSSTVPPETLTYLTNEYLAYIVAAVEDTGGYVDKFIGDAVMAIWGAPLTDADHAVHAVRAALEAARRVHTAHREATARGEVGFDLKIGINSGDAVVGNVGTERRFNYTAVGETVNLASRLESVPGLYRCRIVVAERTATLAQHEVVFRELDRVRVKGHDAPLTVFEPLGPRAAPDSLALTSQQQYEAALRDYRARRFVDAATAWSTLDDGPAAVMAARAREFSQTPPDASWDGVWTLAGK